MMRGCTEATRDWSMMFILEDFLLAIDMGPKLGPVMARVIAVISTGRKAHFARNVFNPTYNNQL
jgi:hypothetical protein